MNQAKEAKKPQLPGHPMMKDSVACGTVLATIMLTMVCGAFVVQSGPDAAPSAPQLIAEGGHD